MKPTSIPRIMILLAGWKKKPILTLFFDAVMCGGVYAFRLEMKDRYFMSADYSVPGISYYLLDALVAVVAVAAVWLFIAKIVEKHAAKNAEMQMTE